MTIPLYTGEVPALNQSQPEFDTNTQDFIDYIAELAPELNEFAGSLNNLSTTGTSLTSNTVGTGSKAFTTQAGKGFFEGQSLTIARTSAPTNRMFTVVDSYNGGTGALVVTSQSSEGAGTFTDWTITLGFNGVVGTGQIEALAVTSEKLANDALTAAKIGDTALGFGMINGKIVGSVAGNALTVAVKTLAGADPTPTDPVLVVFRNATITDGSYSVVSITAATSLVVSSGSTLGTLATIQANLAVLLINNAGTAELAINNLSGGVNLDGSGVISSTAEGGAGGADSATVIYSTTARSNVTYRVVSIMEITEATPGTWATAHSKLTPIASPQAFNSVGYGQTWQTVTRTSGVTYYNTTGKPITWAAYIPATTNFTPVIGGFTFPTSATVAGIAIMVTLVVPMGAAYSFTSGGTITSQELR
jgi:hypothetical protein